MAEIWPKEMDCIGSLSEVFVPYETKKLAFGSPHPNKLIEPVGLSLVAPPDIHYKLKMEEKFWKPNYKGVSHISQPQLETVIYAMQAFQQKVREDPEGPEVTRGYFLGAGTGTGKTRELAGLVYESYKSGVMKFVWVTTSKELYNDVKAELLAFNSNMIIAKDEVRSADMQSKKPVLVLTTYFGLSDESAGLKRHNWLTKNSTEPCTGLFVLDEVHKAKNAYSSKRISEVGKNVLILQDKYPCAKFIYSTATSASEVSHLRVMKRLGIWGPGTDFEDEDDFAEKMIETGIPGMEVLALRLKQEGVFSSKLVDFSDCKFFCETALVDKEFGAVFDRYSQMWTLLMEFRARIVKATRKKKVIKVENDEEDLEDDTDEDVDGDVDEQQDEEAMSNGGFYCDCLLFFNSVIKSSKIRQASKITRQALEEGKSVIIGMQHTGALVFESEFLPYSSNIGYPYSNALLILRRAMLMIGIDVGIPKLYRVGQQKGTNLWEWSEEDEKRLKSRTASKSLKSVVKVANELPPLFRSIHAENRVYSNACPSDNFPKYSFGEFFEMKNGIHPKDVSWSYDDAYRKLTAASLARLYHELSFWLPINPTDELIARIERFHPETKQQYRVAELTGRTCQYNYDCDQSCWKVVARAESGKNGKRYGTPAGSPLKKQKTSSTGSSTESKATRAATNRLLSGEMNAFMNGEKRVAIISGAASTGVSLHADMSRKNAQQRVHITLEYSFGPENIVQQLGRSNRSNQATAPEYYIIQSPIPAEVRVTCVAGKRVRQLGAICYGHINGALVSQYLCDDFSTHDQSRNAIEHGFSTVETEYEELMQAVGLHKMRRAENGAETGQKQYFTKDLETFAKKVFNRVMVMPLDFQTRFLDAAKSYLLQNTHNSTIYTPIKDIDLRLYDCNVRFHQFRKTTMYHYKLQRWTLWREVRDGNFEFYIRKTIACKTPDVVAVAKTDPGSEGYDPDFVDAVFPFCKNKVKVERKKLATWTKVEKEQVSLHWLTANSAHLKDTDDHRPGCVHVQRGHGCDMYYAAVDKYCLEKWGSAEFVMLLKPDFQLVSQMQEEFKCTQLVRLRVPNSNGALLNLVCLVIGQEEVRYRMQAVFNRIIEILSESDARELRKIAATEKLETNDNIVHE